MRFQSLTLYCNHSGPWSMVGGMQKAGVCVPRVAATRHSHSDRNPFILQPGKCRKLYLVERWSDRTQHIWPFMAIGPCATNSENGVSLKRAITIYRGPFVYIFHYFTLMYKFCTLLVNFWSCTLCFIRKKNTRDIGSKQANSAPLLPEFWTFKSSEVKIGRYSKERKLDLSFVTIVAGISKHSNHRRLKFGGTGK